MSICEQPLDGLTAVNHLREEAPCHDLIGDSPATRRLRLQIHRIGPHFRTLLLQGEMGTGKELAARALHARSGGAHTSFVHCHGAALADTAEREDFFAGSSPWRLLMARQGGTVFLDSVDEMPSRAQSRLVEILAEQAPDRTYPRMIAAACQSLQRLVAAGRFRPDLYHRLSAIEIVIEPLRTRREDISALAHHIVRRFSALYGKGEIAIAGNALDLLKSHGWPGNVREMENALRNAVLACDENTLEPQHLSLMEFAASPAGPMPAKEPVGVTKLQDVVERHVQNVLQTCSGNKVRAAEMLGISRSTLYRMLDGSAMRDASHP
jgi:DNA-binding NtrC family response regulator